MQLDGRFGRNTEDAVKRFQRAHGLDDDGVVGPITWAALLGEIATVVPQETAHAYDPVPGPSAIDRPALMAEVVEAEQYRRIADEAGRAFAISPALIGGVGSRESRWGLGLKVPNRTDDRAAGTGDFAKRSYPTRYRTGPLPADGGGFGRGLMQIDYDFHEFARTGNWADPQANVEYACRLLVTFREFVMHRASLDGDCLTRAMLASYNCGPGNALRALRDGRDVDFYTAGRNYSADVLRRAELFSEHGWT